MVHSALPVDTSKEAYDVMVDCWAAMSALEKAELIEAMCLEVDELARLGIAAMEGEVSPERERFLIMERRYGKGFATSILGIAQAK